MVIVQVERGDMGIEWMGGQEVTDWVEGAVG
jgi:hypothetical protein